jgi:hypothetical protein
MFLHLSEKQILLTIVIKFIYESTIMGIKTFTFFTIIDDLLLQNLINMLSSDHLKEKSSKSVDQICIEIRIITA